MENILTITIGVISLASSIFFAYLAFRKESNKDIMNTAKKEGTLLSDIGYIKAGIDKLERKLDKVESNYQDLLTRVIKLEEITNIKIKIKKVEEEKND